MDFAKNNEQVFCGEPDRVVDFVECITDYSAKQKQPDEEVEFVLLQDLATTKKRGLWKSSM